MLTLVLALATTGQVRSCQTVASYRQSYAVQSYAAPVYQQAVVAPYVEKISFVAVEDPYYANLVGSQVRAELKAKQNIEADADLASKVGQLADAVGRLEARIGGAANPVPAPQPMPAPTPDQPPPPPVPGPNPPPPTTQPNAAVLGYFKANCLKCHASPAKAGAGFVMFNEDGSLANISPLDKVLIDQQLYSNAMPKGGKEITTEEYSNVRAWIFEDTDAIAAAVKACQKKGSN